MITEQSDIIAEACTALTSEGAERAASIVEELYPFDPQPTVPRKYGPVDSSRVFVRDGFVDRYTGDRLIFPPVLRVLSHELPTQFPYHKNWKTDSTHPAYWALTATVDHLIPVTKGGVDDETNWFTTSMMRNAAKMNWSLEELGWELHPPGKLDDWDGMIGWFVEYASTHPAILGNGSIKQWYRGAKQAIV